MQPSNPALRPSLKLLGALEVWEGEWANSVIAKGCMSTRNEQYITLPDVDLLSHSVRPADLRFVKFSNVS